MSGKAAPVNNVRLACKYAAEAMRQLAEHCNGTLTTAEATRGLVLSAAGSTMSAARQDGIGEPRAKAVFLEIANAAWEECVKEGWVEVRRVGDLQ